MYTLFSVVASNAERVAVAVESYGMVDEAIADALALWHEESGAFRLMFVEYRGQCAATLFSTNDPEIVYVTTPEDKGFPAHVTAQRVPRPT